MRIKLISHNTYWFQGHPFSGDTPQAADPQVLARLCALYLDQRADILCLQEIQSRAVFHDVTLAMKMEGVFAQGRTYPQYRGAICTKLAFGPGASAHGAESVLERMFVLSSVSANGTALGIGNIHLTSGRQSGKDRAGAARLREMKEVLGQSGPEVDILCGDFNEHAGGDVSRFLEQSGYVNATGLPGAHAAPAFEGCVSGGDQIWVREAWMDRVAGCGVIRDGLPVDDMPGRRYLSDHLPVWLELEV